MNLSERIKLIIRWLISQGIATSQEEVGRKLGYKNKSSFSQVVNGKVELPRDFIDRLTSLNDKINRSWLVTGNGDMIKAKEGIQSNVRPVLDAQYTDVVYVPIHAQAGYGRGYGDIEYIESLPTVPVIVDKNYNGNYRVFEVDGDSMDDGSRNAVYDGDKILCRDVRSDLWLSKLHINSWFFVIVMKNDGILIKKIIDHNVENGKIICHSLNPLFSDFEVDLRDVAELYNAIKIIERSIRL